MPEEEQVASLSSEVLVVVSGLSRELESAVPDEP